MTPLECETVYTLPVVDSDGIVTGKRGKVIVPSLEIKLATNKSLFSCPLNVAIRSMGKINPSLDIYRMYLPYGGIGVYERVFVTDKPNPTGLLKREDCNSFFVWVRKNNQ